MQSSITKVKFVADPYLTIDRYSVPSHIKLINAQENAVILMGTGSQFVINQYATLKNLQFLDSLNKSTWSERVKT